MTLTEALCVLHVEGRLKRAWRPGMLYHQCSHSHLGPLRIIDSHPDIELFLDGQCAKPSSAWHWDLDDPATRGVLLELIREATGNPRVHVDPNLYDAHDDSAVEWAVYSPHRYGCTEALGSAATEGEAIASALVQLAQGRVA